MTYPLTAEQKAQVLANTKAKAGFDELVHLGYGPQLGKIDIQNLDIASSAYCVLGQIFTGDEDTTPFNDGLNTLKWSNQTATGFGVYIDHELTHDGADAYMRLTAAWKPLLMIHQKVA